MSIFLKFSSSSEAAAFLSGESVHYGLRVDSPFSPVPSLQEDGQDPPVEWSVEGEEGLTFAVLLDGAVGRPSRVEIFLS